MAKKGRSGGGRGGGERGPDRDRTGGRGERGPRPERGPKEMSQEKAVETAVRNITENLETMGLGSPEDHKLASRIAEWVSLQVQDKKNGSTFADRSRKVTREMTAHAFQYFCMVPEYKAIIDAHIDASAPQYADLKSRLGGLFTEKGAPLKAEKDLKRINELVYRSLKTAPERTVALQLVVAAMEERRRSAVMDDSGLGAGAEHRPEGGSSHEDGHHRSDGAHDHSHDHHDTHGADHGAHGHGHDDHGHGHQKKGMPFTDRLKLVGGGVGLGAGVGTVAGLAYAPAATFGFWSNVLSFIGPYAAAPAAGALAWYYRKDIYNAALAAKESFDARADALAGAHYKSGSFKVEFKSLFGPPPFIKLSMPQFEWGKSSKGGGGGAKEKAHDDHGHGGHDDHHGSHDDHGGHGGGHDDHSHGHGGHGH